MGTSQIIGRSRRDRCGSLCVGECGCLVSGATPAGAAPVSTSFSSPGAAAYAVPAGVCSVSVTTAGGQGGAAVPDEEGGATTTPGGFGGSATATISVTPGEFLAVEVGGQGGSSSSDTAGSGGIGGGGAGGASTAVEAPGLGGAGCDGGGGASSVARGATVLVVASGGGGAGGTDRTQRTLAPWPVTVGRAAMMSASTPRQAPVVVAEEDEGPPVGRSLGLRGRVGPGYGVGRY